MTAALAPLAVPNAPVAAPVAEAPATYPPPPIPPALPLPRSEQPAPVAEAATPLPRAVAHVRRRRRGLRIETVMPYLAALVGLVALGGAVYLDQQNQVRFAGIAAELSGLRAAINAAANPPPVPARMTAPEDTGAATALLALQKRVGSLEEKALAPPEPVTVTGSITPANGTAATAGSAAAGGDSPELESPAPLEPGALPTGSTAEPASVGTTKLADGPTMDCIPVGTRFLVTPGDSYAICRTTETVRVKDVSMEGVLLMSGKMLVAGETVALKFGKCALNVLTADDGFADMKVTCS